MTRFGKKHLIVAANVAALAITVSIALNSRQAAAQQGPPDGLAVRVVNPLPVPVAVNGTANVNVTNANSINVSDANNPLKTLLHERDW